MAKKKKQTKGKIKSLDRNESRTMTVKLVFLLVLVAAGFLLYLFVKANAPVPAEEKEILGEKVDEDKTGNEVKQQINFKELERKANEAKDFILGETTSVVEKSKSAASSAVSSAVYNSTLKPIVDQIERLPPGQKERVKEQICK